MVEHVGIDVRAIGPSDRAELRIHLHLAEERGVGTQRLEDRATQVRRQIDDPLRAIGKHEPYVEAL